MLKPKRFPLAALTSSVALAATLFSGHARAEGPYLLDSVSRETPVRGPARCPELDRKDYGGTQIRYHAPISAHPAFIERLKGFEALTRAVAIEVYGRAPSGLHHLGGFNCRRISGYPNLVSEHGLGNAIDVDSFRFGPLPKGAVLPSGLPTALRGAFEVSIANHFSAKGALGAVHRRFLHRLALRLGADQNLFRVVLGPGYVGHDDHFHLDVAPYRLVVVNALADVAR